ALVVPTYNRAEFLDEFLRRHLPLTEKFDFIISIYDNFSSDNTLEVVRKWSEKYSGLKYHRHHENIGADANFDYALSNTEAEYLWLVGDTYEVPIGGISYFYTNDFLYSDFFVFNLENKLKLNSKSYNDNNEVLNDLSGIMTCLSCLVYSKKIIGRLNFKRYHSSYFIQTGIIFEYISQNKNFKLTWVKDISLMPIKIDGLAKRNWSDSEIIWLVACDSWVNFIFSLPVNYNLEIKVSALKNFGYVSGLFSYMGFIRLREKRIFSFKVLLKYWTHFYYLSPSRIFLLFLSLIPSRLLSFMEFIMRKFIR
ncbi:glycosyltransferase family 2 protein, partial [Kangiella sp.]|uniref:glycosyltransferase family 2 protein n=1 Tax=Kangiella sp. TaxID=1920245 RepID=UPI003A919375